jgi:hypothetical protein
MKQIKEGKPFIIYALVCPLTLEVKYVGQTSDLEQRTRGRTHMLNKQQAPLTEWLRTLGYLKPYRVILERGINRKVTVTATRASFRGRKPIGERVTWLSSCLEAKWIKRFRRTIINRNKTGEIGAYQALVNPSLPWGNGDDAPAKIPPRSVRRPKANRDAEIIRLHRSGVTTDALAKQLGLSERSIQFIVQRERLEAPVAQ